MVSKLQTDRSYFYLLLADRISVTLLFLFLLFGPLRTRVRIFAVALSFLYRAVMLAVFRVRFLGPLREIEKISEMIVGPERHMADLKGEKPIHRLIQCVRQSMENECTSQILASQAEIHALQSRINPHLLYNTLDTIRNVVVIRDSENIAQMIKSLSMLFRYSISRPDEVATLKDELGNIKNYLLIQGYHFPGKFKYQQRTEDEESLQYRLLVLTIQPVIKNVIRYGLEIKAGGGQVSVYAYGTQERFVVRIADGGMGIAKQQIDSLRERLAKGRFVYEQDRDLEERGSIGVALSSVNQRTRFHYEGDYGIKVHNTAGTGTIMEIILPAAIDAKGGES